MAVRFHLQDCAYKLADKRLVATWMRSCAEAEDHCCGAVNVIFCTDEHLLSVNRQFLGHDYYTDVITFDYSGDYTDVNAAAKARHDNSARHCRRTIAGDIFISIDMVASNAALYGQTPRREMLRVMIHGVLHLCGYGDKTRREAKTMREKEEYYLAKAEKLQLL